MDLKLAVMGLIGSSIAASLLDAKQYFYILLDTHIWRYGQFWRLLTYQLCYTNSTEVLFAALSLYNLKTVERMWGSRKYASFLFVSSLLTAVIQPLAMAALRPLAPSLFDYVPAGPTPIIFAVLAQFHAMVPHTYKYRIATSGSPSAAARGEASSGITLSDKTYQYGVACHLALLQWPGSVVGAAVGWLVGYWWRGGLLPSPVLGWRLPVWMVGLRGQRRSGEFEGLRRRLEGETVAVAATGTATGVQGGAGQADRRRTTGQ